MISARPAATTAPKVRNTGPTDRARVTRYAPTATLTIASRARVAGDPMSGMTKNGSTNVATMAPVVLTASSEPDADPSVPDSSPSSAAVAGNVMPMMIVGGRTTIAVERANSCSSSRKWADAPLMNGSVGDARTTAPTVTRAAVSNCVTAISPTTERTRGRIRPSRIAPVAIPIRNSTRMIVNT